MTHPIIEDILDKKPDFLTTKDLIELGVFIDVNAAYQARRKKASPPYIKMKHKILYPKKEAIEYFSEKLQLVERTGPPLR